MSCCGPRSSSDLDPEAEGPSDADLARFGGDEFDPRELDDEFRTDKSQSPMRAVVIGLGAIAALVGMLVVSGVL